MRRARSSSASPRPARRRTDRLSPARQAASAPAFRSASCRRPHAAPRSSSAREVDVRGDVALAGIGQHVFARRVPPVAHQRAGGKAHALRAREAVIDGEVRIRIRALPRCAPASASASRFTSYQRPPRRQEVAAQVVAPISPRDRDRRSAQTKRSSASRPATARGRRRPITDDARPPAARRRTRWRRRRRGMSRGNRAANRYRPERSATRAECLRHLAAAGAQFDHREIAAAHPSRGRAGGCARPSECRRPAGSARP